MKIAAIQMNSGHELQKNLLLAERLIEEAADAGCQLVVLPEYFYLIGTCEQERVDIGEPFGLGYIQRSLSSWAKQCSIWLVGGTIPLISHDPHKVFNSQLLFNPQGQCVGRYDKVHLFSFSNESESYRESDCLVAGKDIKNFDLLGINIRPSICYDLRFPEFFRHNNGYEIITAPAAFTYTTGKAHWELLLRCRAVENQCYVIAAAQTGIHPNSNQTYGHSMIVDPWGNILKQQEDGNGVVIADIDISDLHRIRQQLPALQHRVFY